MKSIVAMAIGTLVTASAAGVAQAQLLGGALGGGGVVGGSIGGLGGFGGSASGAGGAMGALRGDGGLISSTTRARRDVEAAADRAERVGREARGAGASTGSRSSLSGAASGAVAGTVYGRAGPEVHGENVVIGSAGGALRSDPAAPASDGRGGAAGARADSLLSHELAPLGARGAARGGASAQASANGQGRAGRVGVSADASTEGSAALYGLPGAVLQDAEGRAIGTVQGVTYTADGAADRVLVAADGAGSALRSIPAQAVDVQGGVAVTSLSKAEVQRSPKPKREDQ